MRKGIIRLKLDPSLVENYLKVTETLTGSIADRLAELINNIWPYAMALVTKNGTYFSICGSRLWTYFLYGEACKGFDMPDGTHQYLTLSDTLRKLIEDRLGLPPSPPYKRYTWDEDKIFTVDFIELLYRGYPPPKEILIQLGHEYYAKKHNIVVDEKHKKQENE